MVRRIRLSLPNGSTFLGRGTWLETGSQPGPLEDWWSMLCEAGADEDLDLLRLRETGEEFTGVLSVLEWERDSR